MRHLALTILILSLGACCGKVVPSPSLPVDPDAVAPTSFYRQGDFDVREFQLKPGEYFQTQRGGDFTLLEVAHGAIRVERSKPSPLSAPTYESVGIGNREWVQVIEVIDEPPAVTFKLETWNVKCASWGDALSF